MVISMTEQSFCPDWSRQHWQSIKPAISDLSLDPRPETKRSNLESIPPQSTNIIQVSFELHIPRHFLIPIFLSIEIATVNMQFYRWIYLHDLWHDLPNENIHCICIRSMGVITNHADMFPFRGGQILRDLLIQLRQAIEEGEKFCVRDVVSVFE